MSELDPTEIPPLGVHTISTITDPGNIPGLPQYITPSPYVVPLTPYNPLDKLDWTKWKPRHPYDPSYPSQPWEDLFPAPTKKDDSEEMLKLRDLLEKQVNREDKEALKKKDEALKQMEKQFAELAERVLVLERMFGLVKDPDPIISELIFKVYKIPEGHTELSLTLLTLKHFGIDSPKWNKLHKGDRDTKTLQFLAQFQPLPPGVVFLNSLGERIDADEKYIVKVETSDASKSLPAPVTSDDNNTPPTIKSGRGRIGRDGFYVSEDK